MGKWTQRRCDSCGGHGQVSSYTIDGGDFNGADECRDCNGSGVIWRSPKGSLAQYPGGPFIGRDTALTQGDNNSERK